LGAAFAFGWTPCIGPVLASVLTMASSTASVVGGATLLGLYAAGLSVPLLGMAFAAERVDPLVRTLRRHGQFIERLSGVLLVGVGLAYIAGWWQVLFVPLQRVLSRTGWPPL
jgi:cytochrome c-type biogenesis protein